MGAQAGLKVPSDFVQHLTQGQNAGPRVVEMAGRTMTGVAVQGYARTPASLPSQCVRRLSDRISPPQPNPATAPGASYPDAELWAQLLQVRSAECDLRA